MTSYDGPERGMSEYQSREAMEMRSLHPRFIAWLEEAGVLVQVPTSQWEVARYRALPNSACLGRQWDKPDPDAKPTSHVIYRRADGSISWTGDSRTHWAWFRSGQKMPLQPEIKAAKKSRSWTERMREALIERDGTNCWFCGKTMIGHDHEGRAIFKPKRLDLPRPGDPNDNGPAPEDREPINDMTIEHMLSKHNTEALAAENVDVNHIDHLVLAHAVCNRRIGHRPVSEKITYREILHDAHSTMWGDVVQPVATKE